MVLIQERVPKKLSGRTSFFVSFQYNPVFVDTIKQFVPAVFDKKTLEWEIGANYLSKLLDAFTRLSEIRLELMNETQEISTKDLTENEISKFKCKPFEHQIDAINFGLSKEKCLILDSMGLGKTYEAICLAEALHRRSEIEHCLIICGVDSLRQNWKSEIQAFSNESCIVLGEKINSKGKVSYETLQKRAEQLKNEIQEFFIIVNITNVRDDKFVEAFKKSKNKIDMIVFDEAHHCITGDTIVHTDYGDKTILELLNLDSYPKVLSYNFKTKANEFQEINSITKTVTNKELLEFEIEDKGKILKLKCTSDHKIYTTNRGWVQAKNLTFEDDIKIIGGKSGHPNGKVSIEEDN